jgi:hypothetical protein
VGVLPAFAVERMVALYREQETIQMFGWFKSAKRQHRRDLTLADVADVMATYGDLLMKYPTAYIDESWLPVPKEQMRQVFKAAWKLAPTAEMRNYVEVGWVSLSMFQPSVGHVPVDAAVPRDASPESIRVLDRFLKLSEAAKPESDRDYREMQEFKRENP